EAHHRGARRVHQSAFRARQGKPVRRVSASRARRGSEGERDTMTATARPRFAADSISSGDDNARSTAILIVDDDRNHAETSRDALEMVGYQCDVATSGESGLEKLRARQYDLVLTDLVMSDIDGMQIL